MMYPLDDTIAAVASARTCGGIRGIVRLSGPNSLAALEKIGVSLPSKALSAPFQFANRIVLENVRESEPISLPARIYCWPGAHSYTGQTAAEIHTLGVLPFLDKMVENLCKTNIVRIAQPGEYTLRAFLSGRMDLTQAEAVLGTIDAQNPERLSVALHQLAGGLAHPLKNLRTKLFELLTDIEAAFDFAEEDIEFISASEIAHRLADAESEMREVLAKMNVRSASETVPRVVLYGAPNIGKSALFNALTDSQRALVFNVPGTTRDYISAAVSFGDFRCEIVDTAGDFDVEDSCAKNEIGILNQKSQKIARAQRDSADISLYCFDALSVDFRNETGLRRLQEILSSSDLLILTRVDRISERESNEMQTHLKSRLLGRFLGTSSLTGCGILQLRARLATLLAERAGGESDVVASTQSRCRESLRLAAESVERARTLCATEFQELIATEIRVALEQLGLILGAVYTEDILDSIFSRFCVGK